jgi:hypothetical protein
LQVPGGNTYTLSLARVKSLQAVVAGLEAVAYPLFLRVGARPTAQLQPVTARTLLAEVERFAPLLNGLAISGIRFRDGAETVLGCIYAGPEGDEVAPGLHTSPAGIRVVVAEFPPPVGFRSGPGMVAGRYECYFREIRRDPDGRWLGFRTAAMGGSGAPVELPGLAIPPATRWDIAAVSGKPNVVALESVETPAAEVFRDIIHGFVTASTESLRLRVPLEIRRDLLT